MDNQLGVTMTMILKMGKSMVNYTIGMQLKIQEVYVLKVGMFLASWNGLH